MSDLLVKQDGAVRTLTLHRPASRNALSSSLIRALRAAMAEAEGDPGVVVVVLTGSDPAFCAGLDLKELQSGGASFEIGTAPAGVETGHPWLPMTKPVLGAVNGAAFTGGLELALHCDLLLASERAVFADTHAKHGLVPAWGMSVLLPQAVGRRVARQMTLSSRPIDAATALRAGLVSEVIAHGDLLRVAQELAATIAGNHRDAVRALLRGGRAVEALQDREAFAVEAAAAQEWERSRR